MNTQFPPLSLPNPTVAPLRPAAPRFPPRGPVDIAQSAAKARALRAQVSQIQNHLRTLTPDQKRAVFLKLTHDRPLRKEDLSGTGLRPMSSLNGTETLVIPRDGNLDKLDRRFEGVENNQDAERPPRGQDFGSALTQIDEGDPTDRLSPALKDKYHQLVAEEFVIYELEVSSFHQLTRKRRGEVEAAVAEIRGFLGHTEGRIYEADFARDGARLVLSSTGEMFRRLVEDPRWQRTITFFDERPRFQTFHEVVANFNIAATTINPPAPDAETICIIDSGVAAQNPLIAPVIRRDLCRSYVPGCAATVDESDHGSGVASLAAYYDIDPSAGATLQAKAWVASARILTEDGYLDKIEADDAGNLRVRHARLLSALLREIVSDYRPQGIRIFVLAFNIISHYWSEANQGVVSRNAWVARTIDQLSKEFDVVFVTITGNIEASEVEELHQQSPYPAYFSAPLAKILDPGQASLSVTAGSIAHSARVAVATSVPIAGEGRPSPFTRTGPGFGNATKPDFVERGGNFVVDPETGRVHLNQTTSVLMASNAVTPALKSDVGTIDVCII